MALKVVQLPAGAAGDADADLASAMQTRERMAVMEAVVSVTMSHPNIVQVRPGQCSVIVGGGWPRRHVHPAGQS